MKSSMVLLVIFIAGLLFLIVYVCVNWRSPAMVDVNVKSNEQSERNVESTAEVYEAIERLDFQRADELIKKITSLAVRNSLTSQMNQIIEQTLVAASEDADCLDVFLDDKNPYKDFWIEVALRNRLIWDSEQPYEWFEKNQSKMSVSLVERCALAFARHQCSLLDWRKARDWFSLIEDEELRKVVNSEINSCTEARIRQDVAVNAMQAMAELLSEESGYEVFWLEIGMNEMLVNQPVIAERWYAASKDKLNTLQHERVALSYIRHHLINQRLADALPWRKLIVSQDLQEAIDLEFEQNQ